MAAVTICSDTPAKVWHCFPIYFPWSDGTNAMILVFWMLSFKPTFSLSSFTFIKRLFSLTFCHKGGVICISEAIDISPGNLDSSLCFFQPSVSHDVLCISWVQFSRSVMSNSLRPHESQHTRPPCPSPTPRGHSDSRPSSPWCHPAISSSVIPFSSCLQSIPASESFLMSQLFTWGGQSTGVSALASFLPKKSQDWSPLGLVGSPCSPRDSQESSPTTQFKSINSSVLSLLHSPTLTSIHDHWKNHSLD